MEPNNQNQTTQDSTQAMPQALQQDQQPVQPSTPTKKKIPIAARILYVLGLLGLILGLFAVVMIVYTAIQATGTTRATLALLGVGNLYAEAAFLAVIVIGGFALIDRIKAGKKWALISYTTLFAFSYGVTLFSLLTASEFDRLLGATRDDITALVLMAPVGLLLAVLWLRNRDYFS